jgi:hypothetical protein
VVGRRDPLLVFDAQVTGSGVAPLELLTTGTPAQFYRLRFVFSE